MHTHCRALQLAGLGGPLSLSLQPIRDQCVGKSQGIDTRGSFKSARCRALGAFIMKEVAWLLREPMQLVMQDSSHSSLRDKYISRPAGAI